MAYVTPDELAAMSGLPGNVILSFSAEDRAAALDQASGIADGALRSNYATPIANPPVELKVQVSRIAAFFLMRKRGFDPERGADRLIESDYDRALAWLKSVSRGEMVLAIPGTAEGVPEPGYEGEAEIISGTPRGW